MGSFSGHVNTGIYFTLFSLRWTYCVLMRYYLGRRETALGKTNPRTFKNSLLFPFSCRPGIPIEAYILLLAALFEFTGELVMGIYKYGLMMNGQHMTILFFFIVASFVTILKAHRVITVPNLDYALVILSFLVYCYVLYYHTLSKSMMETQLHINMVQFGLVIAGALAAEVVLPHSFMAAIVRCLALGLLGTWLIHVAFILYHTGYEVPWEHNNTMHLKLAVMMLVWHLAGTLLFMFTMASFVLYRVRRMTASEVHRALDLSYSNTSSSYERCKLGEQDKFLLAHSEDEGV